MYVLIKPDSFMEAGNGENKSVTIRIQSQILIVRY